MRGYSNILGDDSEGMLWGDYSADAPRARRSIEPDETSIATLFGEIESQNASIGAPVVAANGAPIKRGPGRPAGSQNKMVWVNGVKIARA